MTTSEEKQATPLHGPNLILDVENFGPIAEAKNIEFKPMTVFVGPSNTGKTYLAMLMHSFSQAYNNTGFPYIWPIRFAPSVEISEDQVQQIYESFVRAYDPDPRHHPQSVEEPSITLEWTGLADDLRRLLLDSGAEWGKWAANHTEDFLIDNFQVKQLSCLRQSGFEFSRNFQIRVRDTSEFIDIDVNSNDSLIRTHGIDLIVNGDFLIGALTDHLESIRERRSGVQRDIGRSINHSVATSMRRFSRSIYLPASRTGIMSTYGVLVPTVIRSPSNTESDRVTAPQLNRLVRDFLGYLATPSESNPEEAAHENPNQFNAEKIAKALETTVMGGSINVSNREFGVPSITYELNDVQTPIERTSSMVTELAPIVLVLRHHARSGDLLIIDEPEAHLHPEAQQKMAAALAFMVRSGLRVLITTHSHYMVEQLGNFVAVSTLEPDLRKRVLKLDDALGNEDIHLDESEVAVYDFATDKSEHGSVVETVEFNQDYGYFPRDHNRAIADQMNRTQRVIEARIDQDDPVSAQ